MTIDPRFGFWFSIVMAVVSALGICGTQLTTLFGDIMANKILAAIVMLNVVNSAINAILHAIPSKPGSANEFPLGPKAVPIILFALMVAAFYPSPASAQIKLKPLTGNIVRDIEGVSTSAKAAVTGQPAPDPTAALTCDFKMLTKLTPENLIPTAKACLSDANQTLVNDTQRALTSAKAYVGPNGGNPGDGDGINCLTPGLAIFKAGVQIPAVPAVVAADGTITTPAVPAQDPGPILLYQKYREFTLAGGLSACMTWFNGPIVATTAAGAAGAATAIGAAAALAK